MTFVLGDHGSDAPADLDPAAAAELGRHWVDACNRRDAEALIEIADPRVRICASKILGEREPYSGHDGIRQWIADIVAAGFPLAERVTDVHRRQAGNVLVVVGQLLVRGTPVSPFSILMSLRDCKVVSARAFLTDETELTRLGWINT